MPGVGVEVCNPTKMDWGPFDCSAREAQDCAVCVHDGNCEWCSLGRIESSAAAGAAAADLLPKWFSDVAGIVSLNGGGCSRSTVRDYESSGYCMSRTSARLYCPATYGINDVNQCERGGYVELSEHIIEVDDKRWSFVKLAVLLPFVMAILFLVISRICLHLFLLSGEQSALPQEEQETAVDFFADDDGEGDDDDGDAEGIPQRVNYDPAGGVPPPSIFPSQPKTEIPTAMPTTIPTSGSHHRQNRYHQDEEN